MTTRDTARDRRVRCAALWAGAAMLTLAAPSGPAQAQPSAEGGLEVTEAWVDPAPGGATQVRMIIANRGDRRTSLVGARSPRYARAVAILASPTTSEAISLPPDSDISLRPSGPHLTLLGLRRPLRAGRKFPLRLLFTDNVELTVLVDVGTASPHP